MALFKGRKQNASDNNPDDTSLPDTDADLGADTGATSFDPDPIGTEPEKKTRSPLLLAAGLASLVVAIGVGSYFFFFAPTVEDIEVPDVPAARQAQVPDDDIDADADPDSVPADTETLPESEEQPTEEEPSPPATELVEVHEQSPPPPPAIRDFIAAQDGKGLQPNNAVPSLSPPSLQLSPELHAQLQTLWKQGAAAKWRGDYEAARRAWREILRLQPGHPGIQEAIDKLP